jgi:hypothetical protein
MIVTTTHSIDGRRIKAYLGIVSGEAMTEQWAHERMRERAHERMRERAQAKMRAGDSLSGSSYSPIHPLTLYQGAGFGNYLCYDKSSK